LGQFLFSIEEPSQKGRDYGLICDSQLPSRIRQKQVACNGTGPETRHWRQSAPTVRFTLFGKPGSTPNICRLIRAIAASTAYRRHPLCAVREHPRKATTPALSAGAGGQFVTQYAADSDFDETSTLGLRSHLPRQRFLHIGRSLEFQRYKHRKKNRCLGTHTSM